jgi:hypothetical protein
MIELNAQDSGWILITKYWTPTCYKDEHYQWAKDTDEKVLKNCDKLVSYYLFITRGINSIKDDQQYVKLYNINHFLLEVAEKVLDTASFVLILRNFNSGEPGLSPSQVLFYELRSALQNLYVRVIKNKESIELIKFDYTNVLNPTEADEEVRMSTKEYERVRRNIIG